MMEHPFKQKKYIMKAIDPIHVGTGGYRLGRVDNTIVREPATNIPKIPGSSLAGVLRAYTAMAVQAENPSKKKYLNMISREEEENENKKPNNESEGGKNNESEPRYISCAGKGGESGDSHCGKSDCEVCVTYGFSRGAGTSFQGLAQFSDARILFFPVFSFLGPVWITSYGIMKEHIDGFPCSGNDCIIQSLNNSIQTLNNQLNLGWSTFEFGAPIKLRDVQNGQLQSLMKPIPSDIKNKTVVLSDSMFSTVVNDNLEVRTSVSIDPYTGAAAHGALFTYEAIPRITFLFFDVLYNNPKYFLVGGKEVKKEDGQSADWTWIETQVLKGIELVKIMGVGGMGTRGMGRAEIFEIKED